MLPQIALALSLAFNGGQTEAAPAAKDTVESQVVIRREDAASASEMQQITETTLSRIARQWDQPTGGKTILRLSGVWRQEGTQWKLVFRVVADHLDLVATPETWVRLGDSRTVTVTDNPGSFTTTLERALDTAVDMAMGTVASR